MAQEFSALNLAQRALAAAAMAARPAALMRRRFFGLDAVPAAFAFAHRTLRAFASVLTSFCRCEAERCRFAGAGTPDVPPAISLEASLVNSSICPAKPQFAPSATLPASTQMQNSWKVISFGRECLQISMSQSRFLRWDVLLPTIRRFCFIVGIASIGKNLGSQKWDL